MAPAANITQLTLEAVAALHRQTGLEVMTNPQPQPAGETTITITKGLRHWRFNVEVKPWLNRTTLALLKDRIRGRTEEWLIVTRYATAGQADELRNMNLAFLDTVGNAFINRDELHVFIKGIKPEAKVATEKADFFRPADLKVLFAFLCRKGLEAKTHQEIKEVTGVGLGTINRLIHALQTTGRIVKLEGQERRLIGKKNLLDQWAIAYPQRLRPKLMIGRFTAPKERWWKDVDPTLFDAQWGEEIGAYYITHYLGPETATIYIGKHLNDFIVQQRLRRDPRGNVEVLKRFWNLPPAANERAKVVPPLLVYADLMATGIDRNIETARMIYDQELAGLVGEG